MSSSIVIGITGSSGFIGSHLWNRLSLNSDYRLVRITKMDFLKDHLLNDLVNQCDVIFHLAGVNRHEDQSFLYRTNIELAQKLIDSLRKVNRMTHLIYSSTLQEGNDSNYGQSKLKVKEMFCEFEGTSNNFNFTSLLIPNVFGPFCKPFYNSVVATFCSQICNGLVPEIHNDLSVNLIYVNKLISEMIEVMLNKIIGNYFINHQYEIKVSELNHKLALMYKTYFNDLTIPNLGNKLDLDLFLTLRCYMPHNSFPVFYSSHSDQRGSFVEVLKSQSQGQFSYSTTVNGVTRGNHFHTRKIERFAVIQGKAKISLRKIDEEKIYDYFISGENSGFVDIPIWYTHSLTNIGEEDLITLFWINEPYNEEDSDTFYLNV